MSSTIFHTTEEELLSLLSTNRQILASENERRKDGIKSPALSGYSDAEISAAESLAAGVLSNPQLAKQAAPFVLASWKNHGEECRGTIYELLVILTKISENYGGYVGDKTGIFLASLGRVTLPGTAYIWAETHSEAGTDFISELYHILSIMGCYKSECEMLQMMLEEAQERISGRAEETGVNTGTMKLALSDITASVDMPYRRCMLHAEKDRGSVVLSVMRNDAVNKAGSSLIIPAKKFFAINNRRPKRK